MEKLGICRAHVAVQAVRICTSRRMHLIAALLIIFVSLAAWLTRHPQRDYADRYLSSLPSVTFENNYQKQASKYNESKVAVLVENRPIPFLAPLMLHFISVVPPDWRFRFMGSDESVGFIKQSVAIREQVAAGKLDLTYIPSNMSTASTELISRFWTNLWLYEVVLQPAEWLLVFQTDSILCANSRRSLNDYLEYDWVGSPWNPQGDYGGNGGLSLRRVSSIIDVLRSQERLPDTDPEDVWLTERLAHRPGAHMANGSVSMGFSGEIHWGEEVHVEPASSVPGPASPADVSRTLEAAAQGALIQGIDDWRDGLYEPMGYHIGGGGQFLHPGIWADPRHRKYIWEYCPEIKMVMTMDVAKYVPGECSTVFPRSRRDRSTGPDLSDAVLDTRNTEIIDGFEYPVSPAGLVPF